MELLMLEQIIPSDLALPGSPSSPLAFGNVGTQEMIVIMVVALIVFGPRKLPEIGRQIGNAMREFKKFSHDVQDTFNLREHLDIDSNLYNINNNNSHATYDHNYNQYDTSYGDAINAAPTEAYPALDQYGLETGTTEIIAAEVATEVPVKAKRTRKPKAKETGAVAMVELAESTEITEIAPPKKRAPRAKKVAATPTTESTIVSTIESTIEPASEVETVEI
jgi:sec-independent protein translocase protein TatA